MKKFLFPLVIIIFIFPAIAGLFHPGFFPTDDGNSMIIRFSAFYEALRQGQFPVRFLPRLNFSYGYPVADFLYPLFMYIGVPLKILGFSFVTSIKIILGGSMLFSGLFTFFWLKEKFSSVAAFTGALAYALFPYHLWDLYKRGSVGEILGLAIIPLIFWQIEKKNIALTGIGIALLILAHNVLALLFLPIIFFYILLTKSYSYKKLFIIFSFGLGCSAFFWIPALFDRKYTIFDKTIVSEFQKYFLNQSEYSLFGFIFLVTIIISIYSIWRKKEKTSLFFWILSVCSVLLTLPVSSFVWKYIPGTSFIQFPFRFLSITTLSVAFLSALFVSQMQKKYVWMSAVFFIVVLYISAANFSGSKIYENYPDTFYSTNQDSTTVKNEYMPIWVKQFPAAMPQEKVVIAKGNGTIENMFSNGNTIKFTAHTNEKNIIQINTVYFPGWKAMIDNKEQTILYDNPSGVMQIPLQKGTHTITAKFTETTERLISDMISIISFIGVSILFFLEKRKYGKV